MASGTGIAVTLIQLGASLDGGTDGRRVRRLSGLVSGCRAGVLGAAFSVALAACGGDEEMAAPRPPVSAPARVQETVVMWRGTVGTAAAPSARYDIVALDASARRPRVLTPRLGGEAQPLLFDRPSWSPDGDRIAFTVELDGDPGAPYRTDVYLMDADGGSVRRLTRSELASHPLWSPEGRTIAFAKRASARPGSARDLLSMTIWTISADGSGERKLVPPSGITADVPGAWSPDGESLAFTRHTYVDPEHSLQASAAIHSVGADGSNLRQLIEQGAEPAWSPDGGSLAYVSDRDRNGKLSYGDRTSFANELYRASADGSDQRRLTSTRDRNERTPAWSPDSTRIAYTRGEQYQNAEATSVLVVEADGDCPTEIAADPPPARAWYANAVWRPGQSSSRFTPTCP